MKSKIINLTICLILIFYYYICVQNTFLQIIINKNGWYLGEWIINYQDGGFKRRGFFGSFFILINEITSIRLDIIVFSFLFTIYTAFFGVMIDLFCTKKNNLIVISILLLPTGFGMLLKDPTIAAKKEIFFMLLYLLYFQSFNYKIVVKDIVVSVLLIIAILNHELAFFFIPFISFIYFVKNTELTVSNRLKNIVFYHLLPATVTILILHQFGLSIRTANSLSFLKDHGLVLGQIGIYGYDPDYNVFNFYKSHFYTYQTYIISILLGSAVFAIYCKFNSIVINKKFILIQILFLIPLFWKAYDWGRWVNIFFSLLTIYIIGEKQLASNWKKDLIALFLIIFNSFWGMMLFISGFTTFPFLDSLIKRTYYYFYFKISKFW